MTKSTFVWKDKKEEVPVGHQEQMRKNREKWRRKLIHDQSHLLMELENKRREEQIVDRMKWQSK